MKEHTPDEGACHDRVIELQHRIDALVETVPCLLERLTPDGSVAIEKTSPFPASRRATPGMTDMYQLAHVQLDVALSIAARLDTNPKPAGKRRDEIVKALASAVQTAGYLVDEAEERYGAVKLREPDDIPPLTVESSRL